MAEGITLKKAEGQPPAGVTKVSDGEVKLKALCEILAECGLCYNDNINCIDSLALDMYGNLKDKPLFHTMSLCTKGKEYAKLCYNGGASSRRK